MWRHALNTTEISSDFVSFEKLSRARPPAPSGSSASPARVRIYDLLIIDEAHHARNQATRRFVQLKELARNAKVLLLTATPIHNRREELSTLLSLFLGSRAATLTSAELGRCIIRRAHDDVRGLALIPNVAPTVAIQISDDVEIVRELMMLPDPIPVRDGGLGRELIARGLVHQWASSEAALDQALRRRIARAFALIASLEAGRYPTERELRSWIFDDGALQLGFPEFLSAPTSDAAVLLESMRIHSEALRRLRASRPASSRLDKERADVVARIRAAHPKAKIVAFAQYAETVSMLFRVLAKRGGVALLTARGARVAGGRLSRKEALARFAPRAVHAPPPSKAEAIDLLLTTDLLSEGVNLQDADVVVHLDIPWTAARLEQRVGRAARMGSTHPVVSVYLIRPPATAVALLESEMLVQRKWSIARHSIGSADSPPFPDTQSEEDRAGVESVAQKTERLRSILDDWRRPNCLPDDYPPYTLIATVSSPNPGFIAAVSVDGRPDLLVRLSDKCSTDLDSQILACQVANGADTPTETIEVQAALGQISEWFDRESALDMAGLNSSRALRRKRIMARIDAAIETAAPHSRNQRLATAAKARDVASGPLSAAIESELESLARALLSDDEWLAAVAELDSARPVSARTRPDELGLQIHAVVLLRSST